MGAESDPMQVRERAMFQLAALATGCALVLREGFGVDLSRDILGVVWFLSLPITGLSLFWSAATALSRAPIAPLYRALLLLAVHLVAFDVELDSGLSDLMWGALAVLGFLAGLLSFRAMWTGQEVSPLPEDEE